MEESGLVHLINNQNNVVMYAGGTSVTGAKKKNMFADAKKTQNTAVNA
jgi:hypothetical protein